nr:PREDICTED: uncharacterized protein LOC105663219 [Megachile rotundata]
MPSMTPIETQKLLSSCEDKVITSNSNVNLTKRLFLKLSALSSNINNKVSDRTSNNKYTLENVKNELCIRRGNNFYQNSQKDEKNTCFSDTDLKFLVISSKKSNENKNRYKKILFCKWNSGNINSYNLRNNTSSKLIELKCANKDTFSNNIPKYEAFRSKSNCLPSSLLLKSLATNSFSDSVANESNILLNFPAYTNSTMSSISKVVEVKSEEKSFTHVNPDINKLQKIESNEYNVHSKKMKMKSSADILKSQIKEIKIPERKVKSEDNLMILAIKNENTKDFISIPEKDTESLSSPPNHSSETNEIYDELGILFSQYMKLQIKPCKRNYCIRTRHLKRIQHSTKKCHTKFNYHQIYSYDQRPMCNCGNICEDTYDELQLMFTLMSERKNIYQRMFTRRKKFLNQPCMSIN